MTVKPATSEADDLLDGVQVRFLRGGDEPELLSLLQTAEVHALARRCEALLERPVFPEPPVNRRSVPWPMI